MRNPAAGRAAKGCDGWHAPGWGGRAEERGGAPGVSAGLGGWVRGAVSESQRYNRTMILSSNLRWAIGAKHRVPAESSLPLGLAFRRRPCPICVREAAEMATYNSAPRPRDRDGSTR